MKSSNHMEQLGLVRALQFLADNSLPVATLITDRHNQISKYMAEVKPDIDHHYDVWHVSKGMLLLVYLQTLLTDSDRH